MVSELDQMTQSLVDAAKPERILLFGSQAHGTANPSSDYDFALIFSSADQLRKGLRRANRALWPRRHPVDLIGLTSDSIDNGRTALAREVLETGKVLYSK
jgi:predicted nucleotidyltransferase